MIFQEDTLKEIGIFQYGVIDTKQIVFSEEVRHLCEVNYCGKYGTSWVCPPAIGTVDECKEECMKFDKGLVFTGKYDLLDSFDYEGMMEGHKAFKDVCYKFSDIIKEELSDFLLLSNEGCIGCKKCTYPDNPCILPEKLTYPVEGYGIMVNELAKAAKINYINGANTVTYFGLLLY